MGATDAVPVPRKGVAFRLTFAILDADGDPVTGSAGLDSEISKDGGSFLDCTNESVEIGNGVYYLDVTATEMNADTVAIAVKTSTSGAKTSLMVIYPEEAGDVRSDTIQISGDSSAADNAEAFFDGSGYAGTNNVIPTVTNLTNPVALTSGERTTLAGIIWATLTTSLTTVGSIGAWILDKLDVKVSSVSTGSVPTVAQIWNYAWRTLTTGNATSGPVVETNTIQAYTFNSFSQPILSLGSLANYTAIYFTVKSSSKNSDSESVFQVVKKPGGGDGLLYANKAVATDATKGSITIDDASAGNITVAVDKTIMALLKSGEYVADAKIIRSSGVPAETLRFFDFHLDDTVTKAVS